MNQEIVDSFNRQLDSLSADVSNHLDELCERPQSVREDIVTTLLKYACQSQRISNITLARKALSRIPRPCLSAVLEESIEKGVDLTDDWEYRRLLELLRDLNSDLVSTYVSRGLTSEDAEIREAAEDFRTD